MRKRYLMLAAVADLFESMQRGVSGVEGSVFRFDVKCHQAAKINIDLQQY
jgi:hypothetical protein